MEEALLPIIIGRKWRWRRRRMGLCGCPVGILALAKELNFFLRLVKQRSARGNCSLCSCAIIFHSSWPMGRCLRTVANRNVISPWLQLLPLLVELIFYDPRDSICFLGAQGFSTIPKTGAGGCTFLGFGLLGPCMYQIPNWVTKLCHEPPNLGFGTLGTLQ